MIEIRCEEVTVVLMRFLFFAPKVLSSARHHTLVQLKAGCHCRLNKHQLWEPGFSEFRVAIQAKAKRRSGHLGSQMTAFFFAVLS
jgi:hypothetical protein